MEKGFYHLTYGYWQTVSEPSQETLSTYPSGTIEVPIKPGAGYTYDGTKWIEPSKEWLDETKSNEVRQVRNYKLKKVIDPLVSNPLRWSEMSADQQQRVKEYRQSLLDISKQSGFPHAVVWPTEP